MDENVNLSDISDSELIELKKQLLNESYSYEIRQLAKKVSLNSAYGCMGGSFFRFYDIRNAEAITYMGQAVIKTVEKYLNQYLQKISGNNLDVVIAGDTDSVAGDSIIRVNDKTYKISEFFDLVEGEYLKNDTFNNNYVKKVEGYTTPSVTKTGELQYKPIKYVMKHKVKKRLYRIKTTNKSVTVTEDHSLIAITKDFISQEIQVLKPGDLTDYYFLLQLNDNKLKLEDFTVSDLGVQEEWVYDIEVEDNHNFFANDICVHNSCFLHLEPIINKVFKDKEPTEKEVIDFLCNICDNNLQVVIDKIFNNFTKTTNAYENHLHMKREKICSTGLWKAKKNYILNVWDNEGVRYSEPKIKISGIEAVKTSTPAVCRDKNRKAIEYIMSATEDDLIRFVKEFRQEFFNYTPEQIAFPKRVTDIDKWSHPVTLYIKRTPIQVRASLLYNNLLETKNLVNKYPVIKNGESIKYCYLREPNPIKEDVIGFVQTLPKEFGLHNYIDYQKQFDLTFINPITKIIDVIGWKTEKMPTLDDLFN
jgi:DNA polymerase elongation subunit (family B)